MYGGSLQPAPVIYRSQLDPSSAPLHAFFAADIASVMLARVRAGFGMNVAALHSPFDVLFVRAGAKEPGDCDSTKRHGAHGSVGLGIRLWHAPHLRAADGCQQQFADGNAFKWSGVADILAADSSVRTFALQCSSFNTEICTAIQRRRASSAGMRMGLVKHSQLDACSGS